MKLIYASKKGQMICRQQTPVLAYNELYINHKKNLWKNFKKLKLIRTF